MFFSVFNSEKSLGFNYCKLKTLCAIHVLEIRFHLCLWVILNLLFDFSYNELLVCVFMLQSAM